MKFENIIGMPVETVIELLGKKDIKITDFSKPDKYHTNAKASKRVVKAIEKNNFIELFVAGFVDSAE